MQKKWNTNIIYWSTFVTLLFTYVIPCKHIDDISKSFGFPFGWFRVHNDRIGDVILSSTAVDLFPFFINTVIFYLIISWIYEFLQSKVIS